MDRVLPKLRNISFKVADSITGSKISNAYDEIREIDLTNSDDLNIINFKKMALNNLITHALTTADYYNQLSDVKNLFDFPVINKETIKSNYNKFISNKFEKDKLFQMSTSGSTGTPFISYQNLEKKRRVNAEVIYYSNKVGYSVGDRLVYLRGLTSKTKKSKLNLWLQNEDLIDVSSLGSVSLKNIIKKLENSPKETIILSYASSLDLISKYCREYGIDNIGNLTGVISSSEMLYDDTRESISKLLNCKVYSRYSNQENGIIGQDESINNNFVINEASYYVEIFDLNEDKVIEDGEVGRIVITDLFNYAMPMIRYDTGDVGSKQLIEINGRKKNVINNFGGRIGDIITDTYGNNLSSVGIGNNMSKFENIQQYQLTQKNKDTYEIKVVIIDKQDIEKEVKNLLRSIVGEKANISVKYVSDIPALPSGKRKYIVNGIY